jgi:hypothetical protein
MREEKVKSKEEEPICNSIPLVALRSYLDNDVARLYGLWQVSLLHPFQSCAFFELSVTHSPSASL